MRSLIVMAVIIAASMLATAQTDPSASAISLSSAGTASAALKGGASASTEMPKLSHFNPEQGDKALDPCNDFFKYACNKWNAANPIPSDQVAWGTFNELAIWNIAAVHNTLEQAAASAGDAAGKKAGDYYASCMDEDAINKAGIMPLKPALDRIKAVKSKSQLPEIMAYLHQTIRPPNLNFLESQYPGILFGLYSSPDFGDATKVYAVLDQSGMSLPSRDFYLKDDEKSKQIREQFVAYVAKIMQLSGESEAQASDDAKTVLAMETALATAAMDIVMRRDPKNLNNKMSLEQVQELTPSFNWKSYLAAVQAPASPQYLVFAPDFYRGMEKLIASEPLDHWKAYLKFSLLRSMANSLSQAFVQANFDFFTHTLFGAKEIQPRWRRCSIYADTDLGDVVGQAYAAKYFPPENKTRMLELVKGLETALHQDIDSQTWMAPETKKLAHAKLSAQIDKIGYPDQWRDYSSVEIKRGDFLGNVSRASKFEFDRRLSFIGKPTDRQQWTMTPPTVNAYEDPQTNTINFPAGILQPPFFEISQIDAVNYGGIGMVIGHELIHGYDDQGRKFDKDGNLKNWWTDEDSAAYDKRGECISDEYTQDVPEAGVKQNGKLSQGEDTADNGGIHIAMSALENKLKSEGKNLDSPGANGLTQLQTFFLSYANIWCGDMRPEAARTLVMSQGHSLDHYRVNNVVSNLSEFQHAFGCKSGQPMVRANACRVW